MRELLAYSQGAVVEEKLALRIKANNDWDIYLPTAWYWPEGTQDCEYDWKVSIDGGAEMIYTGVGSSNGTIRVWYGLNPLSVHTVIVKPNVEEYGWLRAFWYKGTAIAGSLINIISDKSYKWYANSDIYSWNWYKAYQYYGCVNLINTDEELLPVTLEIIGDYYRYYEYSGCTSLVKNAEEKILKTVKVIGDNYRAYQYENCEGLKRVDMRAINWASVGNNYRQNQYVWIGTDRNLVNIYIEGWIVEWGNWWLSNSNVKWIYVYKDLVGDYQAILSWITSSKIKKNSDWDNMEYEFIEFIALADSSGEIRIPVGWYSISWNQDCAYDWYVSVDGWEEEEITGTGSATYVSVGSWLMEGSEHRIIIKPKTIWWWWGRAFWYYNTWAQVYIKELIHDSYKCYASNRTETWNYYKYRTYYWCTSLVNSYEKLPTSVITIWTCYMKECYKGDTSLVTAFWEILHKWCTVWVDYRYQEYMGCTALKTYQWMVWYTHVYPSNYKYGYLAWAGDDMNIYITRYEKLWDNIVASLDALWYVDNYTLFTVTIAWEYNIKYNVSEYWTQWATSWEVLKNWTQIAYGYAIDRQTINIDVTFTAQVWDVITMNVKQWSYGSGDCNNIRLTTVDNIAWISNNNVNWIYCFIDDIYNYTNSSNWSMLKEKFKWWYYNYVCNEFIDINRYTKLLATINMPRFEVTYEELRYYNRWIAIDRKKNWSLASIWATKYGKDSKSNNYIGTVNFKLNTINSEWYRVVSGVEATGWIVIGWSNWSGGNMSFFNALNYDVRGNIYGNFAYNGSNYDYYGLYPVWRTQWGNTAQNLASAISRNGKNLWWNNSGWWLFHTDTAYNFSSTVKTSLSAQYWNLIFSDDGLKMVVGDENWSQLKQYNLTIPRDITTAVSTDKILNIQWQVSLSSDCKYLFRFDDTTNTLYQYTYE